MDPPDEPSPLAAAFEWVGRIMAVAVEMVLPGVVGYWLDTRLGTGFLAPVGFALGLAMGIYHLVLMTRRNGPDGPPAERKSRR